MDSWDQGKWDQAWDQGQASSSRHPASSGGWDKAYWEWKLDSYTSYAWNDWKNTQWHERADDRDNNDQSRGFANGGSAKTEASANAAQSNNALQSAPNNGKKSIKEGKESDKEATESAKEGNARTNENNESGKEGKNAKESNESKGGDFIATRMRERFNWLRTNV